MMMRLIENDDEMTTLQLPSTPLDQKHHLWRINASKATWVSYEGPKEFVFPFIKSLTQF